MHYKRNKDKDYLEEQYNRKKERLKGIEHYKRLDFLKAVSKIARKIIEKDTKILNINDYREVAKEIYKNNTYIKAVALKRMMSTDIAKNMINQELIRFYNESGLNDDKAKEVLKLAIDTAIERKETTNLLKISEKYEKAKNLVSNSDKVQYKETREYKFSDLRDDSKVKQEVTVTTDNKTPVAEQVSNDE